MAMPAGIPDVRINELKAAEGRALLEQAAQRYLDMSAEEFIQAWHAGRFDNDPDRSEVMRVAMLLPFAE